MAYKTYNTPMQGTSTYHLRLGYELVGQNQQANTSTVKYALWIVHTQVSQWGIYNLSGGAKTWVKVGGQTVNSNNSFTYDFRSRDTYLAHEGTITINHDNQGNGSFNLQGHFDPALDGYGLSIRATTATLTVPLPKIARVREFTLEKSTVDIGQNFIVNVTEPVEGYSYRCEIVHGNKSYPFVVTMYTSFSLRAPNDLLNRLADRTSAPVTVRMTTISGGRELGTTSRQATVTVPAGLRPSIESVGVKNPHSGDEAFFKSNAYFLAGQSRARVQITPNSQTHGARITEYEARVVGRHAKRATGTNAILSFVPFDFHRGGLGTYHIEGRVKDSRGRYSDWVKSDPLYAIEYRRPRLGNIQVTRAGTGSSAVVVRNYEVDRLDLGEGATNVAELTFGTRRAGIGDFTKNAGAGSRAFELKNSEATLSGTFQPTEGYEIKAVLKDYFSEVTTTVALGTEAVPLDISKDGIGVGKMHEAGGATLQVHGGIEVSGGLIGKRLSQGVDLNNIKEPGVYHEYMDAGARALKNCPASEAFMMRVTVTPTERFVYQEITTRYHSYRYVRGYYIDTDTWHEWNQIGFTDRPWSPLSVHGGLEKDFDQSAVFAVRNGVGYVKFHNVSLNQVHTGAPILVSRVPSEYAPSRDFYISLAPAHWEPATERMILSIRTNGEIWCIRNTHAGLMMTSDAIALI